MSASRLTERRTELLALIDSKPRPSQPELSPNEIKQQLVLIADRTAHADEWQRLKDVPRATPYVGCEFSPTLLNGGRISDLMAQAPAEP